MCNFLRENAIVWDIKKIDYQMVDKKAKLWEDQAKAMGTLFGTFKGGSSLCETPTPVLTKRKAVKCA